MQDGASRPPRDVRHQCKKADSTNNKLNEAQKKLKTKTPERAPRRTPREELHLRVPWSGAHRDFGNGHCASRPNTIATGRRPRLRQSRSSAPDRRGTPPGRPPKSGGTTTALDLPPPPETSIERRERRALSRRSGRPPAPITVTAPEDPRACSRPRETASATAANGFWGRRIRRRLGFDPRSNATIQTVGPSSPTNSIPAARAAARLTMVCGAPVSTSAGTRTPFRSTSIATIPHASSRSEPPSSRLLTRVVERGVRLVHVHRGFPATYAAAPVELDRAETIQKARPRMPAVPGAGTCTMAADKPVIVATLDLAVSRCFPTSPCRAASSARLRWRPWRRPRPAPRRRSRRRARTPPAAG